MDEIRKQVVERLKQANNILVTVRNNPTVDLLSACIGLALVLDKMDKHAAAVFSGAVPSTIEFLKPEETIERTPDSLRDFIIALDKSKADKLRYKVEDKVVRIFITPYKTSLSQKDLEFSQGDFNVDAIIALGVHEQQELDQAVTVHGRILHDATVISINNTPNDNLGSMVWQDIGASSISEMITQLVKDLDANVLDEQIATALLTGIVAETERFSNEKTTPETMNLAGELMAAGANQQLVATSLEVPAGPARPLPAGADQATTSAPAADATAADDGTLDIDHEAAEEQAGEPPATATVPEPSEPDLPKITPGHELLPMPESPHIDNVHGSPLQETSLASAYSDESEMPTPVRSYLVDEPSIPSNTPKPDSVSAEPSTANPFDMLPAELPSPILGRANSVPAAAAAMPLQAPPQPVAPAPIPTAPVQIVPPLPLPVQPAAQPPASIIPPVPAVTSQPPAANQTLQDIEQSVHSSHVWQASNNQSRELDAARNQVLDAFQHSSSPRLEPYVSLNANPLGAELHPRSDVSVPSAPPDSPPANIGIEVDADGNLKQVTPQPAASQPFPPVPPSPTLAVPPAHAAGPPPMPSSLPPSMPPPMTPPNYTNHL
jgi:nanoRNase/pAp phosphatase (c-di-AMP/oligoRNAs hydrolase)